MAGRRSEAPIPPKIAQKMMTGARLWVSAIVNAPTA